MNSELHFDAADRGVARAEELLQCLFDETMTEEEAVELERIWDRFPETEAAAAKNFYAEEVFRFDRDSQATLSPGRLAALKQAARQTFAPSEGGEAETDPAFEADFDLLEEPASLPPLRLDELPRLAAESRALPRPDSSPAETPRSRIKAFSSKADGWSIPLNVSIPLILIVFAFAVYFEWNPSREDADGYGAAGRRPMLAVVTNLNDVRWSGDSQTPKLGAALPPGLLRFDAGSLELLFLNGTRGVVEGPAELLLVDDKHVFCKKGNWSVTVPEQGKGFEIQTPNLTIRDLGTEFFAAVAPERCDLHVLKGLVETETNGGARTEFRTGQAARYQAEHFLGKPVVRFAAQIDRFVTRAEMRRRSDRYLARSASFRHSPAATATPPICLVDFDGETLRGATVYGGETVEGRTPDRKAFRFKDPTDRIRVRPGGEHTSMTAVVRLRIDRLSSDVNPILMSEETKKNGLVWQIRPNGKFAVGIRSRQSRQTEVFQSPVVFTKDLRGRWVQLALTVDGKKRNLTVCVDGDPVFSAELPRPPRVNLNNELNVGCWKMHAGSDSPIRQIDGAVEKLVVYDRALTIEEIRKLDF